MKNVNLYFLLLIGILTFNSCKKADPKDEVNPGQNTTSNSASIDGSFFEPTSISAIGSTQSYSVSLTEGSTTINLVTSNNVSGTYSACSTCKLSSGNTFSGTVTIDGEVYEISSGSLELTVLPNGSIDVEFSFEALNSSSESVSITNGTFSSVSVVDDTEHPLTSNRWKYPELWEDICDINSEAIQGYEYIQFLPDYTVNGVLELTGTTHGCTGDEWEVGTWVFKNGKYYLISDGVDGPEEFLITIETDGSGLCWSEDGDQECYVAE